MSTRSNIGIYQADGTVRAIYCHWDGYPSHTGKILVENYKDRDKVEKLIALGDLSFLDKELEPPEGEEHSYDHPCNGVTIAYHRDRGEELNEARVYPSAEAYADSLKTSWAEYLYLYKGGTWLVHADGKNYKDWTPVEKHLND